MNSDHESTSILIVEDEGIVARDLEESLIRLGYRVTGTASDGTEAVAMAQTLGPHLIVMDVNLRGDVDGIQAAQLIQEHASIPVIFLTGRSDDDTLRRAVLAGPLGYLVKPFQEAELHCAIEVAIHKHRADQAVREREAALRRDAQRMETLSLIDELTQLRNRRGFFELAEQALKVARREKHSLALFFMDLNGLKQINDTHGHLAGDEALRDAAGVLRHTFRDSDIVARIGGDEFVALVHLHESQDIEALAGRLREHLNEFNARESRLYRLHISIGAAGASVSGENVDSESLEALIARADKAMYEEKRTALLAASD